MRKLLCSAGGELDTIYRCLRALRLGGDSSEDGEDGVFRQGCPGWRACGAGVRVFRRKYAKARTKNLSFKLAEWSEPVNVGAN